MPLLRMHVSATVLLSHATCLRQSDRRVTDGIMHVVPLSCVDSLSWQFIVIMRIILAGSTERINDWIGATVKRLFATGQYTALPLHNPQDKAAPPCIPIHLGHARYLPVPLLPAVNHRKRFVLTLSTPVDSLISPPCLTALGLTSAASFQ